MIHPVAATPPRGVAATGFRLCGNSHTARNRRNRSLTQYDDADWHYGGDFPDDLPQAAAGTHIGMFVAWCLLTGFASEGVEDRLEPLETRETTPGAFLMKVLDERFASDDLTADGNAFRRRVLRGPRRRLPLPRRLLRRVRHHRGRDLPGGRYLGDLRPDRGPDRRPLPRMAGQRAAAVRRVGLRPATVGAPSPRCDVLSATPRAPDVRERRPRCRDAASREAGTESPGAGRPRFRWRCGRP